MKQTHTAHQNLKFYNIHFSKGNKHASVCYKTPVYLRQNLQLCYKIWSFTTTKGSDILQSISCVNAESWFVSHWHGKRPNIKSNNLAYWLNFRVIFLYQYIKPDFGFPKFSCPIDTENVFGVNPAIIYIKRRFFIIK